MKIEFSSQRKELFLFLATNMAGMTSLANQQLKLGFYSFTVRFFDVQNVKIYFVGALINIPLAYVFFLSIMVQGEFVSLSFTYIMHTYARQ